MSDIVDGVKEEIMEEITEEVTEVITPEDYSELFIEPVKEPEPILYAEYDGETIGELMDELYHKMESIPTNKDGFIDGVISIQAVFHPA